MSSFAVEKVLAGFEMVVSRSSRYKIRSGAGIAGRPTVVGRRRGAERRKGELARGERHGRVTGRHKVPFVPIKTSGTEYVRRYKEKRKRAAREGTERDWRDRGTGRWRRSNYDRTDRSGGPGFPLNSQYMIPGNQNEPAFTTSRGGTFPRQRYDRTSDARVARRNDESIGRGSSF